MPIYGYRCERGHAVEVMQRMSDDPLSACATCGASLTRVFHPIAVHFKGSGFYNTDYGKRRRGGDGEGGDGGDPAKATNGDKPAKSDSEKAKPAESAKSAKAGATSSGSSSKSSE